MDTKVENSIKVFGLLTKINVSSILREKLQGNIFKEGMYIALPILIYFINLFFMINSNVLYATNKFSYFEDFSNSIALSVLFFLSYFLAAYYPKQFDKWVSDSLKQPYNQVPKSRRVITIVLIGFIVVALMFSLMFVLVAGKNENAFWIHNLSFFARVYYSLYLGLTWYHSLLLLAMVYASGRAIYWSLKNDIMYFSNEEFNRNASVVASVNLLISNFAYGLFYVGASVIFILNDKLAFKKFGLKNAFYWDKASLILVMIILFLVIFAFVPLQEILRYMEIKKDYIIKSLETDLIDMESNGKGQDIVKRKEKLIQEPIIYTTFFNKLIVVLSVLVPLAGIILQIIDMVNI